MHKQGPVILPRCIIATRMAATFMADLAIDVLRGTDESKVRIPGAYATTEGVDMAMTLTDICRCPFCKSNKLGDFRVENVDYKMLRVRCTVCGARGPIGEAFDEAVVLWNSATQETNK